MSTGWNNKPVAVDTAAIAVAVAAAVDVPTVPEIQTGLARTDELQPAVAAAVPNTTQVQSSCAAALTAAAGVAIPSVAQVQSGLATSSALSTVQTAVNALPSAATVQTSCTAAVTAAAGVAIPSVAQIQSGLSTSSALSTLQTSVNALPSAASVVSAVTASSAVSSQQQAAAEAAIDAKGIPTATKTLAVGANFNHTSVTLSGATTSGTVLTNQGAGSVIYVVAVAAACSVANTTFSLASSGGTTMGAMQILIGNSFTLSIPFGYVIRGGTNTSITANKTSGATVVVDIWYYVA